MSYDSPIRQLGTLKKTPQITNEFPPPRRLYKVRAQNKEMGAMMLKQGCRDLQKQWAQLARPLPKHSRGHLQSVLQGGAHPCYAISKAVAFNMTQPLRALLAGRGVTVHGVFLGPADTGMTRGFEIPKASPEAVKEEDIFPDPASQLIVEGWRTGLTKTVERQYADFVPESVAV